MWYLGIVVPEVLQPFMPPKYKSMIPFKKTLKQVQEESKLPVAAGGDKATAKKGKDKAEE